MSRQRELNIGMAGDRDGVEGKMRLKCGDSRNMSRTGAGFESRHPDNIRYGEQTACI